MSAAAERALLREWGAVRDHDAIAVEDFKPRFLAKSTICLPGLVSPLPVPIG